MCATRQPETLKRTIFNTFFLVLFLLGAASAGYGKNKQKADSSRTYKIIVYKFDSDLPNFFVSFLQSKIENGFYDSKKYILINRDKKKMQEFMNELVYKKHCKDAQCAMEVASKMLDVDLGISGSAFKMDNSYVLIIKVTKINGLKIIHKIEKKYRKLSDIIDDITYIISNLKTEIPSRYYKKDLFTDYELTVRGAYIYNTGKFLDLLRQGGWGGFVTVNAYGLWYNLFLNAEIGYYQCRGKNYYNDLAHYFPVTIGSGYMFRIAQSKFSVSPLFGIGVFVSHLYHGSNEDFKRGFFDDENTSKTSATFLSKFSLNSAYQVKNVTFFAEVTDYIIYEKRSFLQQIAFSGGAIYGL